MTRQFAVLAAALALSGCATSEVVQRSAASNAQILSGWPLDMHRTLENTFEEIPFENGAMSIVASSGGDMRTYRLVPCHDGIVCAGSVRGRHGQVEVTEDFTIVRGLYGRTFWLSPGGDGLITRHGRAEPLAWDSDIVQIGSD